MSTEFNYFDSITLTKDKELLKKLKEKLKEYEKRDIRYLDTKFKIFILKSLLEKKEIDCLDLINEIQKDYPSYYSFQEDFENCWNVIKDYNDNYGENTTGGTGL